MGQREDDAAETGTHAGQRRPFRYFDAEGRRIADPQFFERLDALAIPPAWTDVWISPSPRSKLQATGLDSAGRRQYRYHEAYRAKQEEAKYEKLVRFAERLPDAACAMGEHMMRDPLDELESARSRSADQPRVVPRRPDKHYEAHADLRRDDAAQVPRERPR